MRIGATITVLTGVILVVVFCSQPASAEMKGCYARKYDATHLKKHPQQHVTFIQLQYGFEPSGEVTDEDDLNIFSARVRGKTSLLVGGIRECVGKDTLHCKTDVEGERLTLTGVPDGLTLLFETDLLLHVEGSDALYDYKIIADAENRVFKLNKVSNGHCQYPGQI